MTKEELTQAHLDALMKKEAHDVKHARLAAFWFFIVPIVSFVVYVRYF